MKVFIAGLDTETNTFAPLPTGRRAFAEGFVAHGDATQRPENYCSAQLYVWRRLAEARGWNVAESLCAFAEPGGTIVRPVYEEMRDEILRDLRQAMPVDLVVLALHGAMVAEGYDDCEGDILARIRAIVGERVPVGAELDLHCHITDAMVRSATALVAYKEYPHVDIPDRAADLFRLLADAAEGKTRPVMASFDCRMINTYRTTEQPLRGFVDRMLAQEGRDGILSLSLGHGFPWGDVAEIGAKIVVVADGDRGARRAHRKTARRGVLRDARPGGAALPLDGRGARPGAGDRGRADRHRRCRRQCRRRRAGRCDVLPAAAPRARHHQRGERLLLGPDGGARLHGGGARRALSAAHRREVRRGVRRSRRSHGDGEGACRARDAALRRGAGRDGRVRLGRRPRASTWS